MTKPVRPRSVALYRDVEQILTTIFSRGEFPASVACPSPAAARTWRHRAHIFRSILREQEEHRLGLGSGQGASMFDAFILTLNDNHVVINIKHNDVQLIIGGAVVPLLPAGTEDMQEVLDDPNTPAID